MLRISISAGLILASILGIWWVQPKPRPWRTVIGHQEMTRDIWLSKIKTNGEYVAVYLAGQDTCPSLNQFPKKLSESKIQVWLLEADGSALVPSPEYTSFRGERNAGCESNLAQFWFKASSHPPISLVVSVDDVPMVRPIPGSLW